MGPLSGDFPTLCYGSSLLLFPQVRFAVPERYISIPMQPKLLEKSHLTSTTWKLISWASVVIKSMVPKVPAPPRLPPRSTSQQTVWQIPLYSFWATLTLKGACTYRMHCRMQVSFSNSQEHLPICRPSQLLYIPDHSSLVSLENP